MNSAMQISVAFCFFLISLLPISAQHVTRANIVVEGASTIATNDDHFICATIDWWPHDKCNYDQCPWNYSSVTNLDLSHPLLAKAVKAFKPLRIRVGGSLQDQVLYDIGNLKTPCHQFRKKKDGLFGFSHGCLHMKRWDELNQFFKATEAVVTFGLNALYGRHKIKKDVWGGAWDSTNAYDFMKYTVSKGYQIDSWEFGNELSGNGIGASVNAGLYGKDLIHLKSIVNNLYKNSSAKPSLVAPGGFFEQDWYAKLLQVSGPGILNAVTHHIYNLGAGNDPNLVKKIMDPDRLDKVSETFSKLKQTIQKNGPWASAWVGESGGAFNSGGRHVSDTFVDSFWYLDQLGLASKYNTKVYCRQTLIGGNYGLLNTTTFIPNPDYYSALLWHRLMGKGVLAVTSNAPSHLRAYAHCSKGGEGVTLLLINLSNNTDYIVSVHNDMNINSLMKEKTGNRKTSFLHELKEMVSWVGNKASDEPLAREEYHLTAPKGHLRSQTMALNGIPLELTDDIEKIPILNPVHVDVNCPLYISPLSIAFIVFPNFEAPACA